MRYSGIECERAYDGLRVHRDNREVGIIKKVIVVGLDGLEPAIVSRLLDAGQLPNLARLRDQGGFGRVATTPPGSDSCRMVDFRDRDESGRTWNFRLSCAAIPERISLILA